MRKKARKIEISNDKLSKTLGFASLLNANPLMRFAVAHHALSERQSNGC